MMGAREVLASWAGWLMVSASSTTSCRDLASSKMRSISLCTSAGGGTHWGHVRLGWPLGGVLAPWGEPGPSPMLERVVERSRMACLPRLLRMERLARERSAVMWVMEILGGAEGWRWGPGYPPGPWDGMGGGGGESGEGVSPAIKSVLEEVEEGFLHHVGDLPVGPPAR